LVLDCVILTSQALIKEYLATERGTQGRFGRVSDNDGHMTLKEVIERRDVAAARMTLTGLRSVDLERAGEAALAAGLTLREAEPVRDMAQWLAEQHQA
jgi:hypothetical protein